MRTDDFVLDLSTQVLTINDNNRQRIIAKIQTIFDDEIARIKQMSQLKLGDHLFYEFLPKRIIKIYQGIRKILLDTLPKNILDQFDSLFNDEILAMDSEELDCHAYEFIDACCEVTRIKLELLILYESYSKAYLHVTNFTPIHATNLLDIAPKVKVVDEIDVFSKRIISTNLEGIKNIEGQLSVQDLKRKESDFFIGFDIAMSSELLIDYSQVDFVYLNLDLLILTKNDERKQIYENIAKVYKHLPLVVKIQNTETLMQHFGFTNFNPKLTEKHIRKFTKVIEAQIHDCLDYFEGNQLSFVAPRIYRGTEFAWFRQIFKKLAKQKDINLGVCFDHEYSASHHDEFKKFDFAVVECDLLFESYNDEIEFNSAAFKTFYKEELRNLHYGIYRKRRRDFAYLGTINDREVLHKLINSGYKRFIVNSTQLEDLQELIAKYHDTRGKCKKENLACPMC